MNKYKGGAQFTIWQRHANFSVVDLVDVAALFEAADILVSSYGVPDFGVYYPACLPACLPSPKARNHRF